MSTSTDAKTERATFGPVKVVDFDACAYSGDESAKYREITLCSGNVPTALRVVDRRYSATDFTHADMVLVATFATLISYPKKMSYALHGVILSATAIPGSDRTYIYVHVDQFINPVYTEPLIILSRHFMDDIVYDYAEPSSLRSISAKLPSGDRTWRWNEAQLRGIPVSAISGEHHTHFFAHEVWDALSPTQRELAKHAFRLPSDTTNAMMAGVMLWLSNLAPALHAVIVNSALLDCQTVSAFSKAGKILSVYSKSMQNLVFDDLRPFFEVDVLVNRIPGAVDWQAEKENRMHPRLANVDPKEVYDIALGLFTKPDPNRAKPRFMTWDRFWEARWQWSAAGSVHSQHHADARYVSEERELKNKFITLSAMPDLALEYFSGRQPEIHGWSSTKYEWGKQRAIYGTDITSYVLSHFAFFNCEDTLPSVFPVGAKARPSYVNSRVAAILEKQLPFCLDFEDFNSQHSTASMQAVIDAYGDAYAKHMSPEQQTALAWTRDSVGSMTINDLSGSHSTYKSEGTLLSGWRLTTFMNSVLNYVYTMQLVGDRQHIFNSVHNGDDVLIGTTSLALPQAALRNAAKYNIRVQSSKCAFGAIAEFLRVDHARGEYGQYLTRSVATVVHSRIESKKAITLNDALEAMEERFLDCRTRGLDFELITKLRTSYYQRVPMIYNMTADDAYIIKCSHRVVGGISSRQDASVDHLIEIENLPVSDKYNMSLPGVHAYALALRHALDLEVDLDTITKRVYKATMSAVALVRRRVLIKSNSNWSRSNIHRALHKMHADVADTPMFGKAMLTGFLFDVLSSHSRFSTLSRIIRFSHDPLEFLRIIT